MRTLRYDALRCVTTGYWNCSNMTPERICSKIGLRLIGRTTVIFESLDGVDWPVLTQRNATHRNVTHPVYRNVTHPVHTTLYIYQLLRWMSFLCFRQNTFPKLIRKRYACYARTTHTPSTLLCIPFAHEREKKFTQWSIHFINAIPHSFSLLLRCLCHPKI